MTKALTQRIYVMIALIIAATGVITAITAQPVSGYAIHPSNYRWKTGTVCVIDKTYGTWPVKSAVARWTYVPDLTYKYGGTCTNKIYVYAKYYGTVGWTGDAVPWLYSNKTSGSYEWLGDAWRSYRCTVRMNRSYSNSWDDKRSALMHEFGHCDGLAHTSTYASLMNSSRWKYYNYPTDDDKAGVDRRYPW